MRSESHATQASLNEKVASYNSEEQELSAGPGAPTGMGLWIRLLSALARCGACWVRLGLVQKKAKIRR